MKEMRMRGQGSKVKSVLIIFSLGAGLLTGCRTAPDMRPFADATSQLSGSIKTAGRTVVAEVDAMSGNWDETHRQAAEKTIEGFGKNWEKHQKLADALVDYSASLAAIAEAGEQGEKSAKAVADSFKKLTDAVGAAFPQAKAGEVAVNLGSYLYGKFAQDRAAKTLGESMNRLQPAIDETASILAWSFKDIEDGLDAVRDQNGQNIEDHVLESSGAVKIKVRTVRNRLEHLRARHAALLNALNSGADRRDSLRADLVKAADAAKETELNRLTKLTTDIAAELAVVENAINLESETLKPLDERKAADRERLNSAMNLVRAARGGFGDWAAAHSRLAASALQKKPPQVADLIQTATEIRELIKTVRAGQNH